MSDSKARCPLCDAGITADVTEVVVLDGTPPGKPYWYATHVGYYRHCKKRVSGVESNWLDPVRVEHQAHE